MGTKEGAAKARLKQIEKYGSEEAYRAALRLRAGKGGRISRRNKPQEGI